MVQVDVVQVGIVKVVVQVGSVEVVVARCQHLVLGQRCGAKRQVLVDVVEVVFVRNVVLCLSKEVERAQVDSQLIEDFVQ